MNELFSGIVLFKKTADGTAEACKTALIKRSQSIPSPCVQTLTQDGGSDLVV